MKFTSISAAAFSVALASAASAATVQLEETGTDTNIFTVSTGGMNIGTATLSGNFVSTSSTVGSANSTFGSDSIGFGSQAGTTTLTFNLLAGFVVDQVELGNAGGIGNIGENTNSQRPVTYTTNFDGTATDLQATAQGTNVLTLEGASFTTPTAFAAGDLISNTGFISNVDVDSFVVTSGTGVGSGDLTFTYGTPNGGGDVDAMRLSFTVVPEPSSVALLGLGGLALLARRKRA